MKNDYSAITDAELDQVAGGYLSVSQWVQYMSTQVMPVINGLMTGASSSERTILEAIYGTLQGTAVPGASVAEPVINLWTTYNTTYRSALQNSTIQATLDRALYSAKQYIETHR